MLKNLHRGLIIFKGSKMYGLDGLNFINNASLSGQDFHNKSK